jgi:hypothetical protein
MARKAAATEATQIAPYVTALCRPTRATTIRKCTVAAEHEADALLSCSTPHCLHAVCLDHWINVLGRDPQLFAQPATHWSCEDCEDDSQAVDGDDSSDGEGEPDLAQPGQRAPPAKRAPISCQNFLNLDQYIADVTATQQRLLESISVGLELAPGETAAQQ